MADRVFANDKIDIMWNSAVEDIHGSRETGVTGLKIKDTVSGELKNVDCDGIFKPEATSSLTTAIDLWINDNESALTTYGEISSWDVSQITSMMSLSVATFQYSESP